ncbi:hypothetical protein EYF80_025218 [Liparis tanakae]|uniref:Uncharacterized protein n=1 Tax=Liparis tanakae TaxID=230148 RepID=A0A4Z2HG58_9TELE|nr:hypothetical protein EYF80_025218 [Liparis tanakae]
MNVGMEGREGGRGYSAPAWIIRTRRVECLRLQGPPGVLPRDKSRRRVPPQLVAGNEPPASLHVAGGYANSWAVLGDVGFLSVTQTHALTKDGKVLPAAPPVGSTEMTPGEVTCGRPCEPGEFTIWAKISFH